MSRRQARTCTAIFIDTDLIIRKPRIQIADHILEMQTGTEKGHSRIARRTGARTREEEPRLHPGAEVKR